MDRAPIDPRIVARMALYIRKPGLFVREVLKAEPDGWQDIALQALADNQRVAVRAGHGVGKTATEAWAVLWFLLTRPFPKIPCTAPTKPQLMDVLWPEIAKWLMNAPELAPYVEWQKTRVVMKQYEERWFATARTSNKPENMAGFHEEHLLFVIDEASGVDDAIFETIDGALTTAGSKLVMFGNPTRTNGVFYDAFHQDRELYWTYKISCLDSKMASKDYARNMARKYGEDSDIYRVRVQGEFPQGDPDSFIPLELVEDARVRDLEWIDEDELHIGVDVARFGSDETVLAARIGPVAFRLDRYGGRTPTTETVGRVLALARELMEEHGRDYAVVKVDDTGVGGGVTDQLQEIVAEEGLNIDVIPCNNGAIPEHDPDHYHDWGTESWGTLLDRFKAGEIALKIDDEDLIGQLTTRKKEMTSKGKIKLESKEKMKKRGQRSPDRADALVLAFAEAATETGGLIVL